MSEELKKLEDLKCNLLSSINRIIEIYNEFHTEAQKLEKELEDEYLQRLQDRMQNESDITALAW